MFRFALPALLYTAIAVLAVAAVPASAQNNPDVSIESILDNQVSRFLGQGFREDDRLLDIDSYRETQPSPIYNDGSLFPPDYGGDTHRSRAGRRGSILNIFNLGN